MKFGMYLPNYFPQVAFWRNPRHFFFVAFRKALWGMLIGSCTPNFIEVARLESCQKPGELWLESERKKKQAKK